MAAPSKFSKSIKHIDPKSIIILEGRQRSGGAAIDTSDLEPSIRARGIFNPLVITKDLELIAGERRLRTALKLSHSTVPVRFMEELDPIERKIVELEENERRKDLEWKDHVRAIAELHKLYGQSASAQGDPWSNQQTADMLFYSPSLISKVLRISRDIASPKIANAPTLAAAYNILMRVDERRIGDAMSSISDAGMAMPVEAKAVPPAPKVEPTLGDIGLAPEEPKTLPTAPTPLPRLESILQESFLDWAPAYSGPKFSFVHCDFPYGVNLFAGPQSGRDKWENYDDDPDVYWALIRCFCEHRDKFMAASAHMMFWFDMDFYQDTLELFAKLAPEISFRRKPLIWNKTDNAGILSDPKRGPRHIYETCFIASRDDRFIVRAVSDSYGCHTQKDLHPSVKPEPMLRYFMGMFVDEHTTMLDPTCGSGASLRAAESLGAGHVLGLEINPEFCGGARSALRQFRTKAAMARPKS